jgi:RHS repeat-associated protein
MPWSTLPRFLLVGLPTTKTVNGTTTVFVTDAGNREVLEYDGASGAIQRWYAYGIGSNDVLSQTNVVAGTRAAFIPDIQGSVIAALDSSSGTLSKIGYLPYGKSAGAAPPFGYTGQRIDAETNGLYYFRARHYSPMLGRFFQVDPIGYQGGINIYAYVNNDPLNLIDPFGFGPSYGQSFLQGSVNAAPGTYYAGLAQQQFLQGNYGTAVVYETAAFADAALGIATLGFSTRVGTAVRAAEEAIPIIEMSSSRFGQAAEHIADAQAAGQPSILTIERLGADANRATSTGGIARVPGLQLDEYPPAMFREGGAGASVRAINPADNMSAGAYLGNCCRPLPNGARVQIKVVP